MTSATTREPHGMMGHAHARRRNMKPSRPAESQWCGGADSRGPWITAACFIALDGSKRRWLNGFFFLARVKRRKAQIAWQEGYEDGWGVLANRIQLLYYKQRSEGSRKTGARTTLREKMLCYGAFSSLDSRGKLVGVGHETEQTEPQKETSRK